jgi:hypothetical protein
MLSLRMRASSPEIVNTFGRSRVSCAPSCSLMKTDMYVVITPHTPDSGIVFAR